MVWKVSTLLILLLFQTEWLNHNQNNGLTIENGNGNLYGSSSLILAEKKEIADGLLDVRSIRLSTRGHLFVVETGRNRILKLNSNGQRLDSLGRAGHGDYQLNGPVAMDPANELKMYVADRNNRRIQVFDRRFQYLATVSLPLRSHYGKTYRPSLLFVDETGRLFFYDEDRHRLFRYENNGQYDLSFDLYSHEERVIPSSFSVHDETVWVIDRKGDILHRFSTAGAYLGFIYLHEPARDLCVTTDDIWILEDDRIINISRSGETQQEVKLPKTSSQWRRFDIKNREIFITDGNRVFKLYLQTEENNTKP